MAPNKVHRLVGMSWDSNALCGAVSRHNGQVLTVVTPYDDKVTCKRCCAAIGLKKNA